MADASHVGLVIDEVRFPVEAGKVRELALACGDDDLESVPLTFAVVAAHWRDQAAMVAVLGLDIRRVLHGESAWEHHAPVRVGDVLAGPRVVAGVEVKDSGMTVIAIETRLSREADGALCVVQRDTILEMP